MAGSSHADDVIARVLLACQIVTELGDDDQEKNNNREKFIIYSYLTGSTAKAFPASDRVHLPSGAVEPAMRECCCNAIILFLFRQSHRIGMESPIGIGSVRG